MARYIDADALIERLKASPAFQNFGTDGYFIRVMVIDLVKCQQSADVVPREELMAAREEIEKLRAAKCVYANVDYCSDDLAAALAENKRLKEENAELRGDVEIWKQNRFNIFQTVGLYSETREKVAREIFEKIEKVIGEQHENYVFDNMEIEGVEQDAIIAFADAMEIHFAELKKKYLPGGWSR